MRYRVTAMITIPVEIDVECSDRDDAITEAFYRIEAEGLAATSGQGIPYLRPGDFDGALVEACDEAEHDDLD